MKKNLIRLFKIADKAKNNKDSCIANLIFAYIIKNFSDIVIFNYESDRDPISLEIDFQDYGYYDLVSIRYINEYLCIPVPLLSKKTLERIIKKIKNGFGEFVEKPEHVRIFTFSRRYSQEKVCKKIKKHFPDFGYPRGILNQRDKIMGPHYRAIKKILL